MDDTVETLLDVIGSPAIAVAAYYRGTQLMLLVGQVTLQTNNSLMLFAPTGHQLAAGELVTLHLDNRTGVDEYDADLRVYRTSYKGQVAQVIDDHRVHIHYRDFSLIYGVTEVLSGRQPGYQFPADSRQDTPLPTTPLSTLPVINADEHDNKIGVLVTRTPEQPHTTAMAFLSSNEDDIFIISFPSTFKVQQLQKDPRCSFAIDERATFTFENIIDWNYVLIDALAHEVPVDHPIYQPIKAAFIDKNPWEIGFFANPDVRLYHLQCLNSHCPQRMP
ncbi:hypothetical protein CHH28_17870 [Bacterioplanes sanyensis]|uniref:Uncharacterized protein n=1 Tax=Bacterioplanes sanyensis TaxID=1249553 RepID=A0A222FNS7_9GAMM|nr:pyridoxamine 5'-phosphate oxidase family protein [Bacterioplanes sanyensis]ASP40429.1 hypothetical protein CHH28_17870 [Bacterioplanes sanyensis]